MTLLVLLLLVVASALAMLALLLTPSRAREVLRDLAFKRRWTTAGFEWHLEPGSSGETETDPGSILVRIVPHGTWSPVQVRIHVRGTVRKAEVELVPPSGPSFIPNSMSVSSKSDHVGILIVRPDLLPGSRLVVRLEGDAGLEVTRIERAVFGYGQ